MKRKLAMLLVLLCVVSITACRSTREEQYELIQLQLNKSIQGSFFLGCGSFNGDLYYCGYYKTERTVIVPFKAHYSRVRIIETDKDPYVVLFFEPGYSKPNRYMFMVPMNSIYTMYDVNIVKK